METVLLTCVFAAFALTVTGAPTYTELEEAQMRQYPEEYQYLRAARSQYAPQFVTPCAAAAAAAGSVHLPAFTSPYNLNLPGYGVPQYGYGTQRYRSADDQMAEPELLAFSDMDQLQHGQQMMMDHVPMARHGYGGSISPISSLNGGLAINGPVLTSAGGPAYGVFPNANVGGCNIPLLVSCSPSISSGRLVESQSHYSPVVGPIATGNTYRLVEQPHHHEVPEHSEEVQEQHLEPTHHSSHGVQSHR